MTLLSRGCGIKTRRRELGGTHAACVTLIIIAIGAAVTLSIKELTERYHLARSLAQQLAATGRFATDEPNVADAPRSDGARGWRLSQRPGAWRRDSTLLLAYLALRATAEATWRSEERAGRLRALRPDQVGRRAYRFRQDLAGARGYDNLPAENQSSRQGARLPAANSD